MKDKMREFLKNREGVSIVLAIFVTFLLIVTMIIIQMSLGPVLTEIIAFSNQYMSDNPSELAGEWRVSMNDSLRFYAFSTFALIFALIVWLFINSVKKEWKTFYR